MTRVTLFGRGCLYVALQACLVSVIAAANRPLAFLVGSAISYAWTGNVQAQGGLGRVDRVVYAIGAGTGTVIGMAVGRWLGA